MKRMALRKHLQDYRFCHKNAFITLGNQIKKHSPSQDVSGVMREYFKEIDLIDKDLSNKIPLLLETTVTRKKVMDKAHSSVSKFRKATDEHHAEIRELVKGHFKENFVLNSFALKIVQLLPEHGEIRKKIKEYEKTLLEASEFIVGSLISTKNVA